MAGVRVRSVYASNSSFITYCDADLPGVCGHAVVEEAPAWDVARGRCPSPHRHCSFSGALSGFPHRQKQSLRPFMSRFRLPGAMVDPAIWAGSNTTTTAHYDAVHNFYLQLHGTKTFYLVAPDAWSRLYLAPFGTVHQRQSRLPPRLLDRLLRTGRCPPAGEGNLYPALLGGACGVPCAGPDGCAPRLRILRVRLRPGGALYLPVRARCAPLPPPLRPPRGALSSPVAAALRGRPSHCPHTARQPPPPLPQPFWFHHVVAGHASVSASFWTAAAEGSMGECVPPAPPNPTLSHPCAPQRA